MPSEAYTIVSKPINTKLAVPIISAIVALMLTPRSRMRVRSCWNRAWILSIARHERLRLLTYEKVVVDCVVAADARRVRWIYSRAAGRQGCGQILMGNQNAIYHARGSFRLGGSTTQIHEPVKGPGIYVDVVPVDAWVPQRVETICTGLLIHKRFGHGGHACRC